MARKIQRSGLSRPFLCHLNIDSSHIFILIFLMEEIVSFGGEFFVATLITAWVKTLCLWIL
ncbi:hypothetical protein DB317_07865 [Vibrio cholerae]|nr:hypothetical protein DB317_07865 [Vibrio cholerae]